jgi:uncharacterized protein YbjT (DUF2867 family)
VLRIAVTGASGRIGSQVVRLVAAEQQHQVVALSRRGLLATAVKRDGQGSSS